MRVTRDQSSNTELADPGITVEGSEVMQDSDDDTKYTATVSENVAMPTVIVNARHSQAMVMIREAGSSAVNGVQRASKPINLATGESKELKIVVTAQDRTTTSGYTVRVTRDQSSNTELADPGITVEDGDLMQDSNDDTRYTATIGEDTMNTTVTVTARHPQATVMISDDGPDVSGSQNASKPISLATGESKELKIVVIAQDETTSGYTVLVTRDQSSNTELADPGITVAGSELMQDSDDATRYTATIGENMMNTTVTVTAQHPQALVTIKEMDEDDVGGNAQSASKPISLATGESKELTIRVTAQDDTFKDYKLTVTRTASSNACLSSLTVNDDTLDDDVGCDEEGATSVTINIENSISEVVFQPTAADDKATIKVFAPGDTEGEDVESGHESTTAIPVPEGGSVEVEIEVTAQDGSTHKYTITINRAGSSDADLKDLQLLGTIGEELLKFTGSDTLSYGVNVSNTVTSATVIATVHEKAMIELILDGTSSTSTGVISGELGLDPGIAKQIRIVITSQDETTTKSYTVTVERAEQRSNNAELGSIGISVPAIGSSILLAAIPDNVDTTKYTAAISDIGEFEVQNIENVRVLPVAADLLATISVDGELAESNPSLDFPLTAELDTEERAIPIKVIAADGTTSQTYSLIITRMSSSDTSLEELKVDNKALEEIEDGEFNYEAIIDEDTENTTVTVTARHSQALVTISSRGDSDVSGTESASKPISLATGESKELKIVVTAQDETTTRGYTVRVTRDQSSNVELADPGITVEGSEVMQDSDDATKYTATVSENVAMPTVIVNARHSQAMVTIREAGSSAVNGVQRASKQISLATGESKELKIIVTAQDRTTTRGYTVLVTRDQSSNTELADPGVAVEDGTVTKDSDTRYTATIGEDTMNTTVTVTAQHPQATVTIDDVGNNAQSASRPISLATGESKELKIVVTAQDGMTSQTYTLTVTRDQSSNVELADPGITVEGSELMQDSNDDTRYTATIGEDTMNTTVTVTAQHPQALVTIKEMDEDDVGGNAQNASKPISLATGESKELTIRVTAQDDTFKDYKLTVTRTASSNACLSSLTVNDDIFEGDVGCDEEGATSVTINIDNSISEVVFQPTAADDKATIKVFAPDDTEGEDVESGHESTTAIPVPEGGSVEVEIEVTAQDGSTHKYTITINRARSSDANLKGLQLLGTIGEELLEFGSDILSYEVDVSNTVTSATVIATAHEKAMIELILDGTSSTSTGVISGELGLDPGIAKQIRIVITSQDETTTKSYTVTVERAEQRSDNAGLSSIGISVPAIGSSILLTAIPDNVDTTKYTAAISDIGEFEVQNIENVRVSPIAADLLATISIDDGSASSNPSLDFSLTAELDAEERAIPIKVIADDGATSQTYSLVITRMSSSDTRLESLEVDNKALEEIEDGEFNYEVSISEDTENTTVTVTARHSQALVTISSRGDSDVSGTESASKPISLATGESKELKIVVTAQDETTTSSYTVRVTRDQSSNVELADPGITVEGSELMRDSNDATKYTATIGEDTMNTTVTVTARHPQALVTIKEMDEDDVGGNAQSASKPISLATGESKELAIRVTAQNGMMQEYTLTVTRDQSSNTDLADPGITVADSDLMQDSNDATRYTATIGENTMNTTVTVTAQHPQALVTIKEMDEDDVGGNAQSASKPISLATGESKELAIRVTAQDDTFKDYKLTVTRTASSNACLSSLEVNDDTLEDVGCDEEGATSVTINIENSISEVVLQPTAADDKATIMIGSETVLSGERSETSISVPEGGSVEVEIEVTAQDGSMHKYTITINRAGSSVADLKNLQLLGTIGEELLEFTGSDTLSYEVDVSNTVTSATVIATAHEKAMIELILDGTSSTSTGVISGELGLESGIAKQIRIVITSQDETTTKGYTVTVARAEQRSDNAGLGSIVISVPVVGSSILLTAIPDNVDTTKYTAAISDIGELEVQNIENVRVLPVASDLLATISVDSEPAESNPSLDFSLTAELDAEERAIPIKVIAEDGTTSQTYSLVITRMSSSDTSLESLEVDNKALEEIEDREFNYEVSIGEDTENITVTATARHSQALVTISDGGGSDVSSTESASKPISLATGESKVINIVVTAQDETTTSSYIVLVTRDQSSNTELADPGVTVEDGTVTKDSDTRYTATIGEDTMNTTVTVTARHPQATVTISGDDPDVGGNAQSASKPISLATGESKELKIVVTAQDGMTSQTYTLTVTRDQSSNTELADPGITVEGSELMQDSNDDTRYTATIGEDTMNTTVTVTAQHPQALVTISSRNDLDVGSNTQSASRPISLATGESKELTIRVTAQDNTFKDYKLTVTRTASSNACLSSLRVNDDILKDVGCDEEGATSVTVNIENSISEVVLQPTAANDKATIKIGSETIVSGEKSTTAIPVPEGGSVEVEIEVTAQDGSPHKYTITINRAASSVADLKNLQLLGTNGEVFLNSTDSKTLSYEVNVFNTVTTATMIATAHEKAVIELILDGASSISTGVISGELGLAPGIAKQIRIVITSQDETTTKGYTVTVTRAEQRSDNAGLGSIGISVPAVGSSILLTAIPDNEDATMYTAAISDIGELEVQNIENVRVLPVAADSLATISIDDGSASPNPSLNFSLTAALDVGNEPILIKVIAGDGTTSQTYSLVITRVSSADTRLEFLEVGSEALAINDALMEYRASISEHTMNTTVTVRAKHSQALVTISGGDGSDVSSTESASKKISFAETGHSQVITITVRAQNSTISKVYTLTVTRDQSSDASLGTLQLLPEALGFSFNPANVRHILNIPNPVVGDKTTSIKLQVAGAHSNAIITLFTVDTAVSEGISEDKNKIDADISVDEGETKRIIIEVTAQDGETTKSYTVLLTRSASSDIRLSALTVEPEGPPQGFIFNPTTDTHAIQSHSIELPSTMANTTVTATAHNENARLTIRESTGEAGSPSHSASLAVMIAEGAHKDIIIEVTAQNGTTETYRVIISRASAMDRTTLGFEVELSGFILRADSLTSYTGKRMGSSSDDTIASASVDAEGVSVERIWVDDDTKINYILGGTAQSLTADADAAPISSAIPLPASKIILVLRRTDNTEDGYTEASYTINIESAAVRIRTKVFLEGPLR